MTFATEFLTQPDGENMCLLTLEGNLTIYQSGELKPLFIKQLSEVSHVQLKFGPVTEVDLSFLQVLLATGKSARIRKKRLSLHPTGWPVCMTELIGLAGFPPEGIENISQLEPGEK